MKGWEFPFTTINTSCDVDLCELFFSRTHVVVDFDPIKQFSPPSLIVVVVTTLTSTGLG